MKKRSLICVLLIEALCGAGYDEIVDDYMITYANYYKITEEKNKEKYGVIIENLLDPMIRSVVGDESADLTKVDLAASSEKFLLNAGMSSNMISTLKAKLQK